MQRQDGTTHRTPTNVHLSSGLITVLAGLACYFVSRLFDGGFLRGLFLGATIALMVFGAFQLGSAMRKARKPAELDEGGHWLPSRDGAAAEPEQQ